MRKSLGWILAAGLLASPLFGQPAKPAASADEDAVRKLEQEWSNAQKSGNVEKLTAILADDWIGLGYDGNRSGKRDFLRAVKSGSSKLESFTFGEVDVKVIGNVAIVQGESTETSSTHGENTSGRWVWMDVFVKRGGAWQAVRSQSARVH